VGKILTITLIYFVQNNSEPELNEEWSKIIGFKHLQLWEDSCGPAWFLETRGIGNMLINQRMSLDEPFAMHYLLYLAGCRYFTSSIFL